MFIKSISTHTQLIEILNAMNVGQKVFMLLTGLGVGTAPKNLQYDFTEDKEMSLS